MAGKNLDTASDVIVKLLPYLLEVGKTMIPLVAESMTKDGVKVSQQVTTVQKLLYVAIYNFHLCINRLNTAYKYGHDKDRMDCVEEGIKRGDHKELFDFVYDLGRCHAEANGYYEKSMKAFEEVQERSLEEAEHCSTQARKAKRNKGLTRAGGGSVAGAAAGGALVAAGTAAGIVLSIAAGPFTLGVGTIAGMSITAALGATGAVACVGAGAATHVIASDFKQKQKKFEGLSEAFKKAHTRVSTVTKEIWTMKVTMETMSCEIHAVEDVEKKRCLKSTLIRAVKQLFEQCAACQQQSSELEKKLNRVLAKFKGIKI